MIPFTIVSTNRIKMEDKYYIVSIKHTSKGDNAITLWRADSSGYCFRKDWAGLYTKSQIGFIDMRETENVAILASSADKLFASALYDGQDIECLENSESVREAFNLNYDKMKQKRMATINVSYYHKGSSLNKQSDDEEESRIKKKIESTLDGVEIKWNYRRCGNTTRQVDRAVQILFSGSICKVRDHHRMGEDTRMNMRLADLILRRMNNEGHLGGLATIGERVLLNKQNMTLEICRK
jgi:hypothetical protein